MSVPNPCPVCGYKNIVTAFNAWKKYIWIIRCKSCGLAAFGNTEAEVVKKWNEIKSEVAK